MKLHNWHTIFPILLTFLIIACVSTTYGQLCNGTLGDPVVKITFGAGQGNGPQVLTGTNYLYNSDGCPNDGFYSIVNNTENNCHPYSWHFVSQDHTGDPNGYMMLVNASNAPQDFFVQTITGLCPGTTYEFSAYIMNLLKTQADVDPALVFSIEAGTNVTSFPTGTINFSTTPTWGKYALQFTTPAAVSSIVLRISNTAPGGNGNDLLLDDITFRPCGPIITSGIGGTSTKELSICQGTSATYPLKAIVEGGGNQEFQWQNSSNGIDWTSVPGSTTPETQVVFDNASPGTYQYRLLTAIAGNIGSPSCRTSSDPLIIKVNPIPVTTITANTPLCEGEPLNLTASGGTIYNWEGPDGFVSSMQNPVINNLSAVGAGTYKVTIRTAEGCESVKNIEVVVHNKPIAAFTMSDNTCENNLINFFDQSTLANEAITSWTWDFGDGSTSSLKNPTHIYAQFGQYQVKLVIKSEKDCISDPKLLNIIINQKTLISFNDPGACVDDVTAQFVGIVSGGAPVQSWDWDFGDGSNDLTERFKQNPKHKYVNAQSYSVVLKAKTALGCETVYSKSIIISGATPLAAFSVLDEQSLCSNQIISFKNTSAMPAGTFGRVTKVEAKFDYTGSNSDTIQVINDPEYNAIFTHQYPISAIDQTYRVQLTAYSGTVCYMSTAPKTIVVKGSPTITFNPLPDVCQDGTPVDLRNYTQVSNGFTSPGNWVFSGQGVSQNGMFNPSQAIIGPNAITAIFNPNSNCASESKIQSIRVLPSPSIDAGPDFTMLEGGEKEIQAIANQNLTYKWTLADGSIATDLNRDDILRPIATPKDDITYMLTITSADGCKSTDNVSIKVLKLPKVPNTFTPNGDNINDTWKIMYLESYPNATIEIYNRYGNRVFATSTYQEWDGRINGSELPLGTYYYIINPKNGRKVIKGAVTIVR